MSRTSSPDTSTISCLPRRRTPTIRCPSIAVSGGSKVLSALIPGASADSISAPARARSSSRAVISTSGNSGIPTIVGPHTNALQAIAFPAMSAPIAPDDIVRNPEQASENGRPPLLVLEPLMRFLDEHGLGEGEIEASPIGDGHSNVTYLLERGGGQMVLRRPPRPPLPPSAHDVLREARLLNALRDTPARVPDVLAVCDDPDVIGAPFYVMERIEGEVIVTSIPPALDTVEERRRISDQLIDSLVEIHAVDWGAAGLEGFGKPTGYLERQLRRFLGLWELNKTREIPAVESVGSWLAEHLPSSGPATIVHGDYRLGNTIFSAETPAQLME